MPVLDSIQFNQLVQEVREALLAGSQGVGEVEVVTSLSNLVSLPALRLVGATETVVEAPLELLSAPAVEAAADARKATADAIVAAVNAEAAADLSEAERKDLEEIKLQAISAATDASSSGYAAMESAGKADEATLHAMRTASLLQGKLEEAQVIILAGEANQEILDELNSQVRDSILICANTREEAYSAILQLRELQTQVSQAVMDAYVAFDQMQLSTDDSRHATELAYRATAKIEELSGRTERVIVESVIQTGEARQTVIRLEDLEKDLLFSKSAADIAATRAATNADLAKRIAEATEQIKQGAIAAINESIKVTGEATQVISEMSELTSAVNFAAAHAREMAEKAEKVAADTLYSKTTADIATVRAIESAQKAEEISVAGEQLIEDLSGRGFSPKLVDGVWWVYDDSQKEYVTTGISASSNYVLQIQELSNVMHKEGYSLTANDFTTLLKQKLEGLANYDDTEVRDLIASVSKSFNLLLSNDDAQGVINSFNEIEAFLEGITNTQSLAAMLSDLDNALRTYVSETYIKKDRIVWSVTDLTAGTSPLESGKIYLVYE